MPETISKYKEQLADVFRRHKVERAYVFGSALRNDFRDESDLDFLIKFDDKIQNPLEKGQLWWNLHDALRNLFNREIDLITENSLKNPYFIEELEKTKFLIYGN